MAAVQVIPWVKNRVWMVLSATSHKLVGHIFRLDNRPGRDARPGYEAHMAVGVTLGPFATGELALGALKAFHNKREPKADILPIIPSYADVINEALTDSGYTRTVMKDEA